MGYTVSFNSCNFLSPILTAKKQSFCSKESDILKQSHEFER